MSKQTRFIVNSIEAIVAGLATFFVAGGIVFSAIYLSLVYLLPQPHAWKILRLNVEGALGFLVSVAVGSIVGGYVTSRVVKRARLIHSAIVVVLLYGLHEGYILWGPDTFWDTLYGPLLEAVLVCLPFFMLGTWMGSRKQRQVEKFE